MVRTVGRAGAAFLAAYAVLSLATGQAVWTYLDLFAGAGYDVESTTLSRRALVMIEMIERTA